MKLAPRHKVEIGTLAVLVGGLLGLGLRYTITLALLGIGMYLLISGLWHLLLHWLDTVP